MSKKRKKYRPPRESIEQKIQNLAVDYGIHRNTRNEDGIFVRHLEPSKLERIIKNRWILASNPRLYDAAVFFHSIFRAFSKKHQSVAEKIDDAKRRADGLRAALGAQAVVKRDDLERRNSSAKHKLALIRRAELQRTPDNT